MQEMYLKPAALILVEDEMDLSQSIVCQKQEQN